MDTQTPRMMQLDFIDPNPYQPRKSDDQHVVEEIAASIERNGLMQIPSARLFKGRYQLAFGHTRLAAYKFLLAAGKEEYKEIPLFVRELDDLQMFEMAVAENIKRRDLSPIEQAKAMQRYRDFGKTSAEIGEFFGVNEATVRGTIRLLELPEEAQVMVADGSLTQGNARRLLSLGRLAPQKVVSVAKKLPNAVDPDEVISDALREVDRNKVVEMGRPYHDEPTAGDGLWPLNWSVDLERIRIKIQPTQKEFLDNWKGDKKIDGMKIENIFHEIDRSLTAIIPSLKKSYDDLYETHPEWSPALDLYRHIMEPPLCSACPLMMKSGGYYFCGMKLCHDRKRAVWLQQELESVSKKLKIAIYQAKEDGQATVDLSDYQKTDEELFEARDENLRLKYAPRSYPHSYTKSNTVKVVLVGERAKKHKEAEKVHRAENTYDPEEHKRQMAKRFANQDKLYTFIWEMVTPLLDPLFNGLTSLEALKYLIEHVGTWRIPGHDEPDEKETKADQIAFYRQALAFGFVLDHSFLQIMNSDTDGNIIAENAQKICNKAKTAGIVFPKDWVKSVSMETQEEPEKLVEDQAEAEQVPAEELLEFMEEGE